ncbi:transcription factor E2F6-like isoform X1 [Cervus canadensis]|uniref:transcription factor E2F6-like isoform X1 n=1 Tax=Cervus canadensis TaxID=1574408 RepID=UPI001CA36DB9|nr:transcription factor E2F6-like isoform X1 [Cervus canadensis]
MSQQQPAWEARSLHVDQVEEKTVCGESKDSTRMEDPRGLKVSFNLEDSAQQVSMKKGPKMKIPRCYASLSRLTQRFMALLRSSPGGVLDLNKASEALGVRKRRVYDVISVLSGIELVEKKSKNQIQWIGPDLSYLEIGPEQRKLQEELFDLSEKEAALDKLIKDCSQQMFELIEDRENKDLAYVSYQDIHSLEAFHEQTIFAINAPGETSLDILYPNDESVAVYMKSTQGPINVYICQMTQQDVSCYETSDGVGTFSSESTQPEHPHREKEEYPPEQSEELLEVKTNGIEIDILPPEITPSHRVSLKLLGRLDGQLFVDSALCCLDQVFLSQEKLP